MNPFKSIEDIKARRLAFLEDTVKHYNLNNRSQPKVPAGCVYPCTYYPAHSNTDGCAIGRWLDRDNPIIKEKMNGTMRNCTIFNSLPGWMKEMGAGFLSYVQNLHDEPSHWDEKGLTASGLSLKEQITQLYCS